MKKGSATVVTIVIAIVYMLYLTSSFSDVRHLKNTYDNFESNILDKYEKEYELKVQEL